MEEFLLPCLNKQLFGLECYGCGSQRAMLLLFDGEFSAAFRMFPPYLFRFDFVDFRSL